MLTFADADPDVDVEADADPDVNVEADEDADAAALNAELYPGADAWTVALKSPILFFEFGFISLEYVISTLWLEISLVVPLELKVIFIFKIALSIFLPEIAS